MQEDNIQMHSFSGVERMLLLQTLSSLYLICRESKQKVPHYLSISVSLEESRNPLAKGLLSIFNLVIWEHTQKQRERRTVRAVVRQRSPRSLKQFALLPPPGCCSSPRSAAAAVPCCSGRLPTRPHRTRGTGHPQLGLPSCPEQEEATRVQQGCFQVLCPHEPGCLLHQRRTAPGSPPSLPGGGCASAQTRTCYRRHCSDSDSP